MRSGCEQPAALLLLLVAGSCGNAGPTPGAAEATSASGASSSTASAGEALVSSDGAAHPTAPPAEGIPIPAHIFVGSTSEHACFVSVERNLYCWGRNDAGQIGRIDASTFHQARRVPFDEPVVAASLAERHTCALLASGKVRCFGEDTSGPRKITEDVAGLAGSTHLASGADFTCGAKADGAVLCIGKVPGQAGVSREATRILGLEATDIAASSRALCALVTPELVACVGDNADGELVKGGPPHLFEPTPVPELEKPVVAISMADDGVCALSKNKRVVCHGRDRRWEGPAFFSVTRFAYGADGHGCGITDGYSAGDVDCLLATENSVGFGGIRGKFSDVGVGRGFACAVPTTPAPVVCWGANKHGVLGASPPRPRTAAFEVERLRGATRIEAGDASVCGLLGHTIKCFGDHERKQWGDRVVGDDSAREIVRADDIAVGGGIRCGMTDGLASCWGDNRNNGIISENPGIVEVPTTLASLGRLKRLTFGMTHACAIARDDKVQCWGGRGRARKAPQEVTGFGEIHLLEAGGRQVCALLADGGVSCAPFEGEGARKPARVAGVRGQVALAVGGGHACGIDGKGVVTCFGDGDRGQLGRTDAGPTKVAVVEGLPPSRAIVAGEAFTCALGDDAKVRCWGAGGEGQLGRPDGPLAPVEGIGAAKAITAGEHHACALQDDGKVFCWGDRRFGRFIARDVESSTDPMTIRLDHLVKEKAESVESPP